MSKEATQKMDLYTMFELTHNEIREQQRKKDEEYYSAKLQEKDAETPELKKTACRSFHKNTVIISLRQNEFLELRRSIYVRLKELFVSLHSIASIELVII